MAVSATIENDKNMNFEVNSLSKKVINFFLIPLLNVLPASTRTVLKKTHESANDIIQHATTHKALEILYGHSKAKLSGSITQRFFKKVWLSTNNSKAVRNRLKLVKRELNLQIRNLLNKSRPTIRIVSVASGSSRAIIETVEKIDFGKNCDLMVTFVDKNQEAVLYSKNLAAKSKYLEKFKWSHDSAGNFFRSQDLSHKFNIVEMVGLIDYFSDEKATKIFTQIYNSLEVGGALITANIADNSERPFVSKAVGWKMIYRTDKELAALLCRSGFSENSLRLFYEPLKIHVLAVAIK